MSDKVFKYKSPDFDKLIQYGFTDNGNTYAYSTTILNGQFAMDVDVSPNSEVTAKVTDLTTNEEYRLHLVTEAEGAFVGAVRKEYENVLKDIADKCFVRDVFTSDCARRVILYVRQKYGDELQFLWKTFPQNAVWRRKDNGKWYGIIMTVSKRKLGLNSDEVTEVIDLRIQPKTLETIADGKKYFPGYHMNKKKWYTMPLDGSVTAEEIFGWIDKSYELAKKA